MEVTQLLLAYLSLWECVYHNKKEFESEIYRKPIKTDIIIPHDSCHPCVHKTSSINYILNRLNTQPITKEAKEKELIIIKKYYTTTNTTINKL
jgi:hypothetical protein